ncbi:putative UDP-glucuronosyl/UDP-glucosyltransferase, UDP-glycosyltransferase family [Lupinus albus]|uniref:Putative UDP-glucuronosyl/UDP-glucosyltransferase, UDP-glycosyltransferase family n=1 Tax=Lupinus albus TaxID=3870 RepID=A0A6A4NLD7_LUPAL|nr:putative UDP-glucuronosyl/UDP-glucosyltransferase, UDP-glycosyltransferase family [Lupinus albus]
MDKKSKDRRTHFLLLPYPAQGHINPILQFSKLLQHEGVKVTLVSTLFYSKSLNKVPSNISFETISDGFDKGGVDEAENYETYFDSFRKVGSETLSNLIEKLDKQGQFNNIEQADWILCNTFYELDKEIADWSIKTWPTFRTVGPNIPSMFLDKQHKNEDYCVSQFESEDCIEWLNGKPNGSVVYVSFGSIASIDEDQMKEIAYGLRDSGNYFLWVVRASEDIKLPKDFEKKSNKGLIVKWCSQLKVLGHDSVGCFITHCGWNSTLEALCLGVPLIAIPQMSDQTTNAKYIVDVWKIGIRAKFDEKKIVRKEVLNDCIREILESERGKEIKNNAMMLKNLASKAINEGGSSHKNIREFLNDLFPLQPTSP